MARQDFPGRPGPRGFRRMCPRGARSALPGSRGARAALPRGARPALPDSRGARTALPDTAGHSPRNTLFHGLGSPVPRGVPNHDSRPHWFPKRGDRGLDSRPHRFPERGDRGGVQLHCQAPMGASANQGFPRRADPRGPASESSTGLRGGPSGPACLQAAERDFPHSGRGDLGSRTPCRSQSSWPRDARPSGGRPRGGRSPPPRSASPAPSPAWT